MSDHIPPIPPPNSTAAHIQDAHFTTPWRRLHPLSPLVRAARHVVSVGIVILASLAGSKSGGDHRWDLGVIGAALLLGVISWLVTRWRLVEGVLHIESGVLKRSSSRYPLSRVQAIDIAQSGVARVLGLAELRLRMAGSGADSGRLACLTLPHATELRNELLAIARREREEADNVAAAGPSTSTDHRGTYASDAAARSGDESRLGTGPPLVTTATNRLLIGTLCADVGLIAALLVAAIVVGLTLFPSVATAVISGGIFPILGLASALWKRFNGDYRLTVHATPDGFQLRSGLVETTTETISRDRIQLVRLREPLIWRRLGWCRLEVVVAGGKVKKENRAEGRAARPLMAVGRLGTARKLLDEILPDAPMCDRPAPRRARWKAPLSYRFLSWAADSRVITARRGRLARTTTWVPLAKIQSVRVVEGPVQRKLGLATMRLDTAGIASRAALQDRATDELIAYLGVLPGECQAARAAVSGAAASSRGRASASAAAT